MRQVAAAPLDFYVEKKEAGKIDSSLSAYTVALRQAPKTAQEVKKANPRAVVVGFKAEYNAPEEEIVKKARQRLVDGGWAVALAHDVSKTGFGTLKDEYLLVTEKSVEKIGPAHKRELARKVLTLVRPLIERP